MKHAFKYALLLGAAVTVSTAALAETVQTTTVERTVVTPGVGTLAIADIDLDTSGTITMDEVGERLFYVYDTDGNEVIDNVEFRTKNVVTVTPVEKEIITLVDLDNDGVAEESTYSYTTFMEQTRLSMFDNNQDGLTAHEFIGNGYLETDVNRDNAIDMQEWKAAYKPGLNPHDDSETFN